MSEERKIKIRTQSGDIKYVKLSEINQPPIKSTNIDEELLVRIKMIFEEIKDVLQKNSNPPMTLERFETTFMRSENPETDIKIWERIVLAYKKAQKVFGETFEIRDRIYNVLVFHALDALVEEEKQRDDIQVLMRLFDETK